MKKLKMITKKQLQVLMHQQPVKSIGLPKAWLPQFKTKEHVVAAGHSPLLDVSHLEELLLDTHLLTTLSNNSWLVPLPTVTMVATVDGWHKPSNTLLLTHSRPLLTIHSQLLPGHPCQQLNKHLLCSAKTVTLELDPFLDGQTSHQ